MCHRGAKPLPRFEAPFLHVTHSLSRATVAPLGHGSRIALNLEIRLQDGTLALSAWGEDALTLALGDGTLTSGFENLLANLSPGVETRLLVNGDDLYGPRDPEKLHWLARAEFPTELGVEPGQVIAFDTPGGHELAGMVTELNEDEVRVDFNHPLAGRSLDLRILITLTPTAPADQSGTWPDPIG